MKILLTLACLSSIIGCGHMNTDNKLTAEDISCLLKIEQPDKKGNFKKIFLTFQNISDRDGIFIIPPPLKEDADEITYPILGIDTQYNNTKTEVFAYTNFDLKKDIPSKKIFIPKNGKVTKEYSTEMFWRWSPCGPDRWGSFEKYFKEGDNDVELKVKFAFDEGKTIESNIIKIKCSFQKWLFKPIPKDL